MIAGSVAPAAIRRGRRAILGGVAASLCATAFLAIGILLFGDFGETEGKILATTGLLAAYGLLALPAGILLDQERRTALATILLLLAASGFAVAVGAVWAGDDSPAALGKTLITVTVFALAAAQTGVLAARAGPRDPGSVRRLFVLSAALALVVATMASAAAWAELEDSEFFRILGAVAVLDVLAVALQPVLAFARPLREVFRLRVVVEGGGEIDETVDASDFGAAAAKAIRAIERSGRGVVGVSRSAPGPERNGHTTNRDSRRRLVPNRKREWRP